MATTYPTTMYSQARRWRVLSGFIQDALVDAQHSEAGLRGARPALRVLLSRRLLKVDGQPGQCALQQLCAELQLQGVPHTFHCAVGASAEPAAHVVRIILD